MNLASQFPISFTNSLSGKKEEFVPIEANHVGVYVCGPTVYSDVHLGNVRTFLSFDVITRYFRFLGFKVRYVRNITDVGHLENDADEGEDKISKKARLEKLEPMEIVQQYTNGFHEVMRQFNILPPNIEPSATGHIIEQIEIIKKLTHRPDPVFRVAAMNNFNTIPFFSPVRMVTGIVNNHIMSSEYQTG